MPFYFKKYKMTDDSMLNMIEAELKKNENSTYKFAVGHHPIGGTAPPIRKLYKIRNLLKRYGY